MGLPKQVKRQIDEAKKIEAEMRAAQESPAEPPAPAEPTVVAAAEPAPSPPSEPAAPSPVTAQPVFDSVSRAEYNELLQQHRSLQGIHRSLVTARGELENRVNQQAHQLQELAGRLQQMSQQPQAPAAPNPSDAISKEEIEEYGPELINLIERKARQVAAPFQAQLNEAQRHVQALTERNVQLERVVGTTAQQQTQISQAAFFESLSDAVPQWEALNYDQNFLAWLEQPNPFSAGRTCRATFDEAVNGFDVETTANFFLDYQRGMSAAPVNGTPVQVPQITEHVAPVSRSGPDLPQQQQGRIWTAKDIEGFYTDVSRGKYHSNPQERQRIEREIYKAQRENRIAA